MVQDEFPLVLMIMLCMRCILGGAEKRYARVFKMLVAQPDAQHKLLISRSMLDLLQAAGVLSQEDEPYLIVLDPPFRRYAQALGAQRVTGWVWRLLRPILELLDAFWYAWQCWRVFGRYKPEIVHPLLTGVYLSLPALILNPQIRHVMSEYSTLFEPRQYTHGAVGVGLATMLKQYALQRCHAIDALKLSIRDNLIARGIDGSKIHVAPGSFTDISLCQPASHRKKWVVFSARLIDHKNPFLLVQAIPKVIALDPDIHFYILGQGHLQPQLEALFQELNVTDYVTIRFEPQPTQILNQSSIFVSLQAEDNYPSQSLLEAMACGNAIVATNVGETWRLVDDKNGILVPPTADAVAKAIISLLKDPLLTQRGLASRQRVLSEHTPERFLGYIGNLYQTAARM